MRKIVRFELLVVNRRRDGVPHADIYVKTPGHMGIGTQVLGGETDERGCVTLESDVDISKILEVNAVRDFEQIGSNSSGMHIKNGEIYTVTIS